jgi:hypothetical protein
MAISSDQKLDSLWKRVFYGLASTDIAPNKEAYNESITSYTPVLNNTVWIDSGLIPTPAPTTTSTVVKVWGSSSPVQLTIDPTVNNNRTWLATQTYGDPTTILNNWINPGIDPSYLIQVYSGDPRTGGVSLNQTSTNQEWIFDYAGGVLVFPNTLPPGISQLWITGWQYVGRLGVPSSTGNTVVSNNSQINLNNVVLGELIFSKDDGNGQWGLYMVTNMTPLVITPLISQSTSTLASIDSAITKLITPTSPAVVPFGTLPAGTLITEISVSVITAFDGTPTLDIGISELHSAYLPNIDIDLNNVGDYTSLQNFTLDSDTPIAGYFSPGNSTVGLAEVTLTYIGTGSSAGSGVGGKVTTFIQTVNFNSTSPITLGTVNAGQTVLTTEISVLTAFNGPAATMIASVGTDSNHDLLLSNDSTDLSTMANYANESNVTFNSTEDVKVYFDTQHSLIGLASVSITVSL